MVFQLPVLSFQFLVDALCSTLLARKEISV
jgi:hypothetical protein